MEPRRLGAQLNRTTWEFLGSAKAGPRAAVLFTILAGAKRHRLKPAAYFRDVLLPLSAGETEGQVIRLDNEDIAAIERVIDYAVIDDA